MGDSVAAASSKFSAKWMIILESCVPEALHAGESILPNSHYCFYYLPEEFYEFCKFQETSEPFKFPLLFKSRGLGGNRYRT